jgi:dsRNA-specific ribonuclease
VARLKDAFVTNMFLYKIGKNLELNKYMRTKDPDVKEWSPPFTNKALATETLNCTGKHIADGVESMLGAIFMSTNLFTTLQFISDIQLVPLKQARLLHIFPNEDLLLRLHDDLDAF